MAEHPKYGRCEIVKAIPLPPLEFDFSEGKSLEGYGRAEIPIPIPLPEFAVDMSEAQATPVLELCVHLRAGASPGEVALDLFRLFAAVNEMELSHQGGGLRPANDGQLAEDGTVRLTFVPAVSEGARERLEKIAAALNATAGEPRRYRAIDRFEARAA